MKTSEKTLRDIRFGRWVGRLQVSQYAEVRRRVIDECRVSAVCFSQWRLGRTTPSPLAQDIIDRIAREVSGEPVFARHEGGEGGGR